MEKVVWLRDHARAPSGFKNASIGTVPPEISLSRLANPKDAWRRPAKMLRKCHSDDPEASASSPTDLPLLSAQRSMGWSSDMEQIISTGNKKSQPQIFPVEIVPEPASSLRCDMAKSRDAEAPQIHLGAWLEEFEIDNGEAARAAGCDQSYISNIVAGRKPNINVLYLLKLSEYMGVTVNDFYRPLPSKPHLSALKDLSPKAQSALLSRLHKKG
jgi:hypothetical protein